MKKNLTKLNRIGKWLTGITLSVFIWGSADAQYCASNATSTADTRINNVAIGTLNNASPNTCQSYTDYTAVSAPNLAKGSAYLMSVVQGTCGGSFGSYIEVYIDYNQNLIFEEPSEVVMGASSAGNLGVGSGSVTIPLTATSGLTRMRVVLREGGSAALNTPCGTYTWGETEDYTVNITASALVYCASNATSTADTRINNVSIGTLNNTSPATCQAYTDYTGVSAPSLIKGNSFPMTVTQGTCGGSFGSYTEVYIDYNQNGIFEEPSEIAMGGSSPGNLGVVSGTVAIPVTALSGTTRMRVVLRESGSAALNTPCGTYTWGETEDYNVSIVLPTLSYCASNATSTADTRINNVALGSLNNASPATCQSYTNYYSVPAPTLVRGTSYPASVVQGTCGGSFSSFIEMYIDYNKNGIFEEPSEVVMSGSSPGNLGSASGTVSIPLTALTGLTGMRVVLREGGSAILNTPCGTYTWGETEDYMVNISLPPSYCASNATSTADTRINNVALGSLNNPSPNTCQTYTDYTAVLPPTLFRGNSYTGSVIQGTCGGSFGSYVEMYIDYNQNGIFEEPSEVVLGGSSPGNLGVVSGTVLIPVTATTGMTRMRVVLREGGSAALNAPCGTYTWGETEDYTVIISNPWVYCTSNATSTADTRINNVTVGSLNNTSPNTCQTYTNYTSVAAPLLFKGNSYPGSVTQGTCGGSFSSFTEMYIDFNQNGIFEEPSEIVLSGSSPGNLGVVSGTVVIPATALSGITRMRVVLREGGSAALNTPCGTYTWGETEDYHVDIQNATGCSGTPAAANALASVPSTCAGNSITLSLSTTYTLAGITYQWQSSPNASFVPVTNLGTAATQVTTQSSATYYRCIVTCTNGGASITSGTVLVNMNAFLSCYCNPGYSFGCAFPDQISNVTFAGINNNTLCGSPGANPPPQIFTSPNPSIAQCNAYPLSVTTSGDVEGVSVWFDWNQNGVFEISERVLHSYAGTNPATYTASVIVPQTAVLGTTMMRVRCTYSALPPDDPCAAVTFGEVENYYVTITPGGPPIAPLATSIIGPSTGVCNQNLSFSVGSGYVGSLQWQFSLTPGGPFTNIAGATTPVQPLVASGPATFYLRVQFSGSGCPLPTPVNSPEHLIVIGSPVVNFTTSTPTTSVCRGTQVQITASTAGPYIWSNGATTQSITVSPLETTAYTVTTGTGLCQGVGTISINIIGGPVAAASATPATIECPGATKQLNPNLIPGLPGTGYISSSIPFAPATGSGTAVALTDDAVSAALPIGFNFTFFGNAYTQAYISSNGFIGFTAGMPNGCCDGQLLPSAATPNNLVALAWEDFNPGAGGVISYLTTGSAPNRKFLVNYNNVPHFGGGGSPLTGQIILSESDQSIELHITQMTTNGQAHTQGIENLAGTVAYTTPGRNATSWSASNEAYRFEPNPGAPFIYDGPVTYTWTGTNGFSSNVPNPTDNPMATTTYTLVVADNTCSSSSQVVVNTLPAPVVSTFNTSPVCEGGNVNFITSGSGASGPGTPGTLTVTVSGSSWLDVTTWELRNSSNAVIASGGPYLFGSTNIVPVSPSASDYPVTFYIETLGPPDDNVANYSVACSIGNTIIISGTAAPATSFTSSPYSCSTPATGLSYLWSSGNGYSSTDQSPSLTNVGLAANGFYTVQITDGNGCTSTATDYVTVNANPVVDYVTVTDETCLGFADGIIEIGISSGDGNFTTSDGGSLLSFDNPATFSPLAQGFYSFTIQDGNQCQTFASGTVGFTDNVPPIAVCQDVTIYLDATGNGSTTATAVDNGSSDACGIATLVLDKSNFNCSNVGVNPVILTVTDVNGNSSTCSATVTVIDMIPPTALCQPVTINLGSTGSATVSEFAVDAGSSDACGIASIVLTPNTFTCADLGSNPVTLTVTDVNGNVSTCNTTVTITNNPLVVNLGPDQTFNYSCACANFNAVVTGGCQPYSYQWNTGATSQFLTVCPGLTTTYTIVITDANGNTATDQVVVNKPAAVKQLDRYVIMGLSNKVDIGSNCDFFSGAIGNNKAGGEVKIGSNNDIASFVAAHKVDLSSNNDIGAVYYNSLSNGNSNNIGAFFTPLAMPLVSQLPGNCNCSGPGSANQTVGSGQTRNFVAGANINNLTVGSNSIVRFGPGKYCIRKLDVGSNTYVGAAPGVDPSEVVLIAYDDVQFGSNNVIALNVLNTVKKIQLGSNVQVFGSLTGVEVQTGSNCDFTLDAYCWQNCNSVAPPSPAAVSGNITPCEGATNVAYSIAPVLGATGYVWTTNIPGATFSGSGLAVTVNYPAGPFSGNICVAAQSIGGLSSPSCLAVTSQTVGAPGPVSGPQTVICGATNVNYSLGTSNALSYAWTVPAFASINGASNLNSVNVNFNAGFTNGFVTVVATYTCGTVTSTLAVNGEPVVPVLDNNQICAGQPGYYAATAAGATGFNWTITGNIPTSGDGCQDPPFCSSYLVFWGPSGGTLTVNASNACGVSADVNLATNCRLNQGSTLDTKVYPNPNRGQFVVELNSEADANHNLTITDLTGRVVMKKDVAAVSGRNQYPMDLGFANAGVYMLYVKNADGRVSVTKIVVE